MLDLICTMKQLAALIITENIETNTFEKKQKS